MKKLVLPISLGVVLVTISMVHCSVYDQCESLWWLDDVYHFGGGVIAGWLALVWIERSLPPLARLDTVILGLALVVLIGVLWEFLEYFSSVLSPVYWPAISSYFGIGTLDDTLSDLVFDLWGGLALLFFVKK